MEPFNNLSNKIFNVGNPLWTALMFEKYCAQRGIAIDQNKTISDYMQPLNAVAVGVTAANFTANAINSSATAALQFPQSEHFLITAIRGLDGAAAAIAQTLWVAGIGDALGVNGFFTINNNGSNSQQNVRFSVFQKGTNSPDAGWWFLANPIMLIGQTNLTINATWATAPATANYNMSLELHGLKLI